MPMTFVGHSLVGLGFAAAASPKEGRKHAVSTAVLFVLFANFPDFAFRIIPYYESHNLITVLVILTFATLWFWRIRRRGCAAEWKLVLLGNLAVLSHLLLDTFYNHGKGLILFWPFSDVRTAFPIPWLAVMQAPFFPINEGHVRIWLLEFVTFAPFLFLILLMEYLRKAGRNARAAASGL
jgi:hypothetical protein